MEKLDISLGERIRRVRQAHGLTQKAFAGSLGIAQGFLSSIERGRKVPSDTLLIALTHLYGIDGKWPAAGEGEPEARPAGEAEPAAGKTPLLRRISPEFPHRLPPEDILGHIALPGSTPDGFALLAYGDFMAPTIQDGDLVLFRPGGEVKNGEIVLVNSKWGDIILRRYRVKEDGVWFAPDNNAYTPFQPGPHSRTVGVVTDVWRKVKL
jgi:SOS-response transcriptional repressor LexA